MRTYFASAILSAILSATLSICGTARAGQEAECARRVTSEPLSFPLIGDELELSRNVNFMDTRTRGSWQLSDIATVRYNSAPCYSNPAYTCTSVVRLGKTMRPGDSASIPEGTRFKIQRFQSGEVYLSWGLRRYLRLVCTNNRYSPGNMSVSSEIHLCTDRDIEQLFINRTLAACPVEPGRPSRESGAPTAN